MLHAEGQAAEVGKLERDDVVLSVNGQSALGKTIQEIGALTSQSDKVILVVKKKEETDLVIPDDDDDIPPPVEYNLASGDYLDELIVITLGEDRDSGIRLGSPTDIGIGEDLALINFVSYMIFM